MSMANFLESLRRTNILTLLGPENGRERNYYTLFGRLGQLFRNFDDTIATPRGANNLFAVDEEAGQDGEHQVFDNVLNDWIPLTDELIRNIPETFTFAPKPFHREMELDYFVRSTGLLKHALKHRLQSKPRSILKHRKLGPAPEREKTDWELIHEQIVSRRKIN